MTALLKQKQVKHIYARAIDPVHRSVLEAFGLERILTPEADAARGLVHLLEFGGNMETFQVDAEYYVVKFTIPQKFVGYFVNELKLEEEFRLKIVALKREQTVKNCLGISCREHKVVSELPENCKMQEDSCFNVNAHLFFERCVFIEDKLYNYCVTSKSTSTGVSDIHFNIFDAFDKLKIILEDNSVYSKYETYYKDYVYLMFLIHMPHIPEEYKNEFVSRIEPYIGEERFNNLKPNYLN